MAIILLILFSLVLLMLIFMSYKLHHIQKDSIDESGKERSGLIQGFIYAAIVCCILAIIASLYYSLKGTPYEGHIMEWLNIVVRVMHFTFGIAWIGASFYFVFLENALNRKENVREELAGDLWAVHGGGFYYLEKYKVAPKTIPKHLHWFKYEAYFTWISGMGLLFIIYYFNASAMLIDTNVMKLTATQAISISLGSFVVAWLIYDLMCKSPLKNQRILFAILLTAIMVGFAWFYSSVFSGRAAFIHFGAMIGSIMVANVFFVIIPSQKAMVNAARRGIPPDPQKGKNALFRSIHNNYFTLPVLFVMVSNHFPSTFGNKYQWIVLAAISIGAAGIKHWLNLREQGRLSVWILPVSILILLATAYATRPATVNTKCKTVPFSEVNLIVQQRCVSCHSSRPTDNVYTAAPNGVVYDVPNDIIKKKDLIMQRVVVTKTMPLNNKTGMTPEEREMIRCWLEQGASLK
jgi:uncharacterized membrane protein